VLVAKNLVVSSQKINPNNTYDNKNFGLFGNPARKP
jgi:hypothetical protein